MVSVHCTAITSTYTYHIPRDDLYGVSDHRVYIERPSVVNFINAGGGDPLCTLHRAEGLYSWVTRKGYMSDSLHKS